jgi:Uncharacterised nucleotidyltransferase
MHQRITQWLRYCVDPLGSHLEPPRSSLSPRQARSVFLKADAHHVLAIVLRNFPFPEQCDFEARRDAESRRLEKLALATMLNFHAERILAAAKRLPISLVKGRSFAQNIYPQPALRPFTDIDLLVRPDAIPQLDSILLSQGFTVSEVHHPETLETKWTHCRTGALVEVHQNLVQHPRMRGIFSLTYEDLEGNAQTPAALLTVALIHGTMHYFAWLRHVVDICQAARALNGSLEETQFEVLLHRTGMRFAAMVGLMLAYRVLGELRCLEIAKALQPVRRVRLSHFLAQAADQTATSNSWLLYNTWRRYVFRELMRYGAI